MPHSDFLAWLRSARGHRGNPAAILRVEQLYGVPVLLSGLAPLILTNAEVNTIEQHHKDTIANIQRLFSRTPRAVTFFLAGSLPASALLHLRQLKLFGMISRLPNNVLHKHASNVFKFVTTTRKSWFTQIRQLCLCYGLPHPSCILLSPPTKEQFKKLIKSHVIDYWETTLREESDKLKSLTYFHPQYMSLTEPHPLWTSAGSSPAKIAMATVQAQMLSGKYRTQ